MKKKYKYILAGIIGLIFLIFLAMQFSKGINTTLIEIKPQTLVNSFREEGTIIPQLARPLYAPVPQVILELAVVEGQEVKKGEQLATLDAQELDIELRQLQIEQYNQQEAQSATLNNLKLQLDEAQLQLNTAQKELTKTQTLYNAGAVPKKDLEQIEEMVQLAQINLEKQQEALKLQESNQSLEALRTRIELLEHRIGKTRVIAPIDGIVANLNIKEGDLATINQPLMVIFQNASYIVEAFVLEEEAHLLRKDMEVTLLQDQKTSINSFNGIVENIAPSTVTKTSPLGLEEQRVKVTINFNIAEEVKLFPGAKLDVEFITAKRENVLAVPKTVLFPYEDTEALWVVRKGKATIQTVEKGFENDRYVVIESGLEDGDQVITNPQLEGLKPGVKINQIK